MAAATKTLADLIDAVYRRRYGRSSTEATADERANIISYAEYHVREAYKRYPFYFELKTSTAVVASDATIVLPSDCEALLSLKDTVGNAVQYTQRYVATPTITVTDTTMVSATLTLEYETNVPTYSSSGETTTIPNELFAYLCNMCVAETWGAEQQMTKFDNWATKGLQALTLAMDVTSRQRGLKKRIHMRTYRRGL